MQKEESRIVVRHIGQAIVRADSGGLDRAMASPGMRRLGRSLRSLILPVLVFLVCMQVFDIVLMGLFA